MIIPAFLVLASDFLVVPGHRLGKVHLKMAAVEVSQALGSESGAVSHGQNAWLTWLGKGGGRLDVYLSRRHPETSDMTTVEIVRATSPAFHLPNGAHPGSPAGLLRKSYPLARLVGGYRSALGRVSLWDDVRLGLAWEVVDRRVAALLVHPAGVPLDRSLASHLTTPLRRTPSA